jgi:hypothetical protein
MAGPTLALSKKKRREKKENRNKTEKKIRTEKKKRKEMKWKVKNIITKFGSNQTVNIGALWKQMNRMIELLRN